MVFTLLTDNKQLQLLNFENWLCIHEKFLISHLHCINNSTPAPLIQLSSKFFSLTQLPSSAQLHTLSKSKNKKVISVSDMQNFSFAWKCIHCASGRIGFFCSPIVKGCVFNRAPYFVHDWWCVWVLRKLFWFRFYLTQWTDNDLMGKKFEMTFCGGGWLSIERKIL